MSGYLEVKYPSNLGLNPFKSWKRQWCILRPSPTTVGGGSLAVYCSEAGAPAGTVDLPADCVVRRTKSRTRPHAFAVYSVREPRKPRILLAAQTLNDAQIWMEKIRNLLIDNKLLGSEKLLKDSYSVAVVATELSRKSGIHGDNVLTMFSDGLYVFRSQKLHTIVKWRHISDIQLLNDTTDKSSSCILTVNSKHKDGSGELRFSCPMASDLVVALKGFIKDNKTSTYKKLSKSDSDIRSPKCSDSDIGEVRRTSWYSGPSEVSLDDIDLVMSKEAKRIPSGQLSRCSGAGHLAPLPLSDDSMSDRRSMASGIYEEIPERAASPALYCAMGPSARAAFTTTTTPPKCGAGEEPAYESVAECVASRARRPPPPLPPRLPLPAMKASEWHCACAVGGVAVARHGSLGALPSAGSGSGGGGGGGGGGAMPSAGQCGCRARTLPKPDKARQTFRVFRKRLKSDSRVASSPKLETTKDKDIETKKKRFDFTPTRDIFKSFKVSRKMKGLKIATGLGKGETKSCEFLDETARAPSNRCSKSVECLEANDEFIDFNADLSMGFDDAVTALAFPQEIVDLILRGREQLRLRLKEAPESDYLPMSPIIPPPAIEHQYMVMSPRTKLA